MTHRFLHLASFLSYPADTRISIWRIPDGRTDIDLNSVGFAIEDFSALRYVRDKISEFGMFAELDLLADPDEPRDLYGMLLRCEKKLNAA